MKRIGFLMAGLAVSLLLAGVVSTVAADTPDGLEYTARQGCVLDEDHEPVAGECIAQAEEEHAFAGGLLADYGWRGLGNESVGTGMAGVVGVLVTFTVGGGLFWLLRQRAAARPGQAAAGAVPAAGQD
jgi:cobalt/nickel transport protein